MVIILRYHPRYRRCGRPRNRMLTRVPSKLAGRPPNLVPCGTGRASLKRTSGLQSVMQADIPFHTRAAR